MVGFKYNYFCFIYFDPAHSLVVFEKVVLFFLPICFGTVIVTTYYTFEMELNEVHREASDQEIRRRSLWAAWDVLWLKWGR